MSNKAWFILRKWTLSVDTYSGAGVVLCPFPLVIFPHLKIAIYLSQTWKTDFIVDFLSPKAGFLVDFLLNSQIIPPPPPTESLQYFIVELPSFFYSDHVYGGPFMAIIHNI